MSGVKVSRVNYLAVTECAKDLFSATVSVADRQSTIFDEQQDRYALMQSGWDRGIRVRGNLIYITLPGDKVYIEYDGIERGIRDELISRGIPEDKIVLAFLSPVDKQERVPA